MSRAIARPAGSQFLSLAFRMVRDRGVMINEALNRFHRRNALRRDLRRLDARLLNDVGIQRRVLATEADKPFWRS